MIYMAYPLLIAVIIIFHHISQKTFEPLLDQMWPCSELEFFNLGTCFLYREPGHLYTGCDHTFTADRLHNASGSI